MKILCHLDDQQQPLSLYRPGWLHVFENMDVSAEGQPQWKDCSQLPFRIDENMSLAATRAVLADAVAALDPACRVLLSNEVRGLPYSLLQEEYGFRVWKSEGTLNRQLDDVHAHEEKARAERKFEIVVRANQPVPAPVLIAGGLPGHYWIDLRAALDHHSNPTSRAILLPFLAAGLFVKLEVLCDHLPKWMAWELKRMDLNADSEPADDSGAGLRVNVYSRKTPEGRRRPPGLAGGAKTACLPCRATANQHTCYAHRKPSRSKNGSDCLPPFRECRANPRDE